MQTMSVGEVKARFSEMLEQVKKGEKIVISYGKKHKKVAVLAPYDEYAPKKERKLGLLRGRGKFIVRRGFKMSDEQMLSL